MKIVNDPAVIDESVYYSQISKYLENVKNIDGVISIYLMGSIKAPGLSDIDIIVVVTDDFDNRQSGRLSVKNMDERVFLHGPIVVPYSLSRNIQYVFYASNLQCIYGESCLQKWDDISTEERKLLASCYLVDFIESRFLQFSLLEGGEVDKRSWLTRVWSTVHSLELYQHVVKEELPEKIKNMEAIIRQTRYDWLKKSSIPNELFIEALKAAEKANKFIFLSILEYYYGAPKLKKDLKIISGAKKILFSNDISSELLSYRSKNLMVLKRKVNVYAAEHKPTYLAYLQDYYDVKVEWHHPPNKADKLKAIKNKRKEHVFFHRSWLDEHAKDSGSMKGYIGLDTSVKWTIKKVIERALVELVV
ncbi:MULTISPECIES: hypothetical protein [unclassified Salinivibrio]|uniref:hypothetical protein n=1 Tax=unclassified Salinivibrio TaxID=2636825 RepID=UPI00128D05A6|nr:MULTISPECIES: hypothetical protein [unclassified Salinivibrio]MPS32398.1 hypothetical protein [Salinivibrio sp. VYel7]MPX90679.1 hypothetical protein [Salinivibrio sp. VYel1]MPX93791.1 hypothetical protein [Salinivibrio sp. VYel9]MPX96028.1 hypothetical protein [Salinivibrio sp. VYel6]MPY00256.1 hypothetical protein [Salinivibrio sp. VYel4]